MSENLQQIQRRLRVGVHAAIEIQSLTDDRELLLKALVGLVGVSSRDELGAMETVMRALPAPAVDKASMLDAIHALLATLDEPDSPPRGFTPVNEGTAIGSADQESSSVILSQPTPKATKK